MRLTLLIAVFLVGVLLVSPVVANGVGSVNIKTNAGQGVAAWDHVPYCHVNTVEVWIQNDAPLYEMAIGLEFTRALPSWQLDWVEPYGTLPSSAPVLAVAPGEQAAFDLSLTVDVSQMPDRIFIHGVAQNQPLQAHPAMTKVFTLLLSTWSWSGADNENGFCVDNVVDVGTGKWMFRDQAEYAPLFNNRANNGVTDPSAAAQCFDVYTVPCGPPQWDIVPEHSVSVASCNTYSFDFQGSHWCQFMVWYESNVGVINQSTGYFELPPDGSTGPVSVTVNLFSDFYCTPLPYTFTVNRTSSSPQIVNSTQKLYIRQGAVGSVDYNASDSASCAANNWGLEFISGTPPEFPVTINSSTGEVTVDATNEIGSSQLYGYRLTADLGSLADTSEFSLEIIPGVAGDTDDNGLITISDVVYLINYIFAGGPPPPGDLYHGDSDCNGILTISDAVFNIAYIFAGGPAPCGVVY